MNFSDCKIFAGFGIFEFSSDYLFMVRKIPKAVFYDC